MAKLALNKSSLNRRRADLATFERVLPSLDLKRKQLTAELNHERAGLRALEADIEALRAGVGERLPMLANRGVRLSGLVRVADVRTGEHNLLGTRLPVLEKVAIERRPYSMLAFPHWVDSVLDAVARQAENRIAADIARERVRRLEQALQKTIQRVNLLEKVLIPRARDDIHRIGIALSDMERSGVVRSKIAKRKQREREARP